MVRLAGRLVVNVLYVFFKFFANKDNADFIKNGYKIAYIFTKIQNISIIYRVVSIKCIYCIRRTHHENDTSCTNQKGLAKK